VRENYLASWLAGTKVQSSSPALGFKFTQFSTNEVVESHIE
jgi:hypothetical protein